MASDWSETRVFRLGKRVGSGGEVTLVRRGPVPALAVVGDGRIEEREGGGQRQGERERKRGERVLTREGRERKEWFLKNSDLANYHFAPKHILTVIFSL